jgi:molybdate transport system ATP-binding protein
MLDFAGGRFSVPQKPLPIGARVRIQILARDVSLTLERQQSTSILNIFPAEVEAVTAENASQVTVRLRVGDEILLSRITRKSAEGLGVAAGVALYAQVKSVALLS